MVTYRHVSVTKVTPLEGVDCLTTNAEPHAHEVTAAPEKTA